jgi:hypothetical protein
MIASEQSKRVYLNVVRQVEHLVHAFELKKVEAPQKLRWNASSWGKSISGGAATGESQ